VKEPRSKELPVMTEPISDLPTPSSQVPVVTLASVWSMSRLVMKLTTPPMASEP
jgi:hypothetical protein